MSNDFKDMMARSRANTPKPDAKKRAENIALAQKNFDDLQGLPDEPRPTSDRRPLGWLTSGVANMFNTLTTRGGLAATTAIVALGVIIVTPQGRSLFTPPATLPSVTELPVSVDRDTASQTTPDATPVDALKTEDTRGRAETTGLDASIMEMPVMEASPATAPTTTGALTRLQGEAESDAMAGLSISPAAEIAPAPSAPKRRDGAFEQIPPVDLEDTETFANEASAPLKITQEEPVSTFSIDVDTASYSVIRSSLMSGFLPPRDAVRIEEMINYFPYDYTAPEPGGAPFASSLNVMQTPWNADTQLVHIALQGQMPAMDARPPLNLVFLIDTSGSMQDADKLPLLKQSFRLMLGQLRPNDQVSIVTYAGSAGQVLEPTNASERSTIFAALEKLDAGGSTAGQAGLQQAYSVAESMADDGEITRVILATDGDFNVGIHDPDALKDFIAEKRDSGTYLSVLGFGRGNLDDATMQALAQNGNGTAAYIDTLSEAQKVLVDQLTGALFPIAGDVKVQVEFNPAVIAEYRLIGYETRALAREDFNNDKVDAGEIGAGHSVTAIYEVTPVGSAAVLNDPLRYQNETLDYDASGEELGFLRLRYKEVGESSSKLIEMPISQDAAAPNSEAQFGVAVAGFGQLLRGSDYIGEWGYGDAIALANGALGADEFGYRREAVSLMRLAQSLSE